MHPKNLIPAFRQRIADTLAVALTPAAPKPKRPRDKHGRFKPAKRIRKPRKKGT